MKFTTSFEIVYVKPDFIINRIDLADYVGKLSIFLDGDLKKQINVFKAKSFKEAEEELAKIEMSYIQEQIDLIIADMERLERNKSILNQINSYVYEYNPTQESPTKTTTRGRKA